MLSVVSNESCFEQLIISKLEKYTPIVVPECPESAARVAMDKAVNPIHTSMKRCDRVLEVYAGTVGVSAGNQRWFSKCGSRRGLELPPLTHSAWSRWNNC